MVRALVNVKVPLERVSVPLTVLVVLNVTPALLLIVRLLSKEPLVGHAEYPEGGNVVPLIVF